MLDSQDSKFNINQRGFTLVEILVALTLMSLVMISIYNIVDNNIDTKEQITREDREFLQIYLAIDRIEKDLSLIFTPMFYDVIQQQTANNIDGNVDVNSSMPSQSALIQNDFFPQVSSKGHLVPLFQREDKGEIMFFSSSHRRYVQGQRESRFQWIRYTLEDSEEGDPQGTSRLVRQTINENIYDPALEMDKARSFTLLTGVKSLLFEYWEAERARWVDTYDFLRNRPPLSIRLTLEWLSKENEEGEPEVYTRIIRPYFPQFDPALDGAQGQATNGGVTGIGGQPNNGLGEPDVITDQGDGN